MSRPQRLLLTADAVGGVWQYATDLATALVPLGYETLLAAMGPPPTDAQRAMARAIPGATLVETGLPLDWLAEDAAAVARAGARLAELAGDLGVDLVQLNAPALAAGGRFPAPVVAVAHSCLPTWWEAVIGGAMPADFAWRGAQTTQGLHAADRVVAPSAAFAMAAMRAHRLPELPVVVPNGRAMVFPSAAAMHDFAFTAGRLWDQGKDLATLDRAAASLDIPFKAAGPLAGPHGEAIRFDHLIAMGTLGEAELAAQLGARPVFVSAARYEPFGLAVLEAAMAGCALVLSDIPTFRELWDGAALFVDPGNARGFAHVVEEVIGDLDWRQSLGCAARERAARYTPQALAAGMDSVYRTIARPAAARVAA